MSVNPVDLSSCEREPIHIPGSIQPHGVLLALDPSARTVVQASENAAAFFGVPLDRLLDAPLDDPLGEGQVERIRQAFGQADVQRLNPIALTISAGGRETPCYGILHRSGGLPILELERVETATPNAFLDFYRQVKGAAGRLLGASGLVHLAQIAVEEVRRITGFDRVMVYRFDEEWNGIVIAEETRATLDPYLGLHFPASDIPKQARELYRRNWLRFVVDVDAPPSRLIPQTHPSTGTPLDLSFSVLRSVSPIHLEYLRNMGVAASLSISILKDGQLWGLIACHHATPRLVAYDARMACEFLAQTLSSQLAAREEAEAYEYDARLRGLRDEVLTRLSAASDLTEGLRAESESLLSLTGASGAAVAFGGTIHRIGTAPTEAQTAALIEWLAEQGRPKLFAAHDLSARCPFAGEFAAQASGLLAVFLSKAQNDCVLWFRPEVVRTVNWAGNPHKPVSADGTTLHPRASFALWQERVRGTALPWAAPERAAANEFGNGLTTLALRGAAQELARLNAELSQSNKDLDSFAYIVSHDLKAPLRGISQLAEWLEDDLGPALNEEHRDYFTRLKGRVERMRGLVQGILTYSRVGRVSAPLDTVNVDDLITEVIDLLALEPHVTVTCLPSLPTLMTARLPLQQVFSNLIGNAVKHNPRPDPQVTISAAETPTYWEFTVQDNGPGIPPEYSEKIFQVFQTLQARDDFESTGIGLAIVRRIVEGMGGRIWLDSEASPGAVFRFTWPKPKID